ncbi:MAG: hypothetical protein ABIK98_16135 [Pseudomonadota bacterium]
MAEIKSTLELVMEKTKHLTLSREEKQAQTRNEARQRIKGLIQKHRDAVLNNERFAEELESMQETSAVMVNDLLLYELLDGLHPGRDNQVQLALLNDICGIDITGLASVCDGYKDEIQSMTQARIQALKNILAQQHHISGSAVVPNIKTDDPWHEKLLEIKDNFDQLLSREKTAIKKNGCAKNIKSGK